MLAILVRGCACPGGDNSVVVNILSYAAGPLRRLLNENARSLRQIAERQLVLQAQALAYARRDMKSLNGLHLAEFRAFSQFGEDGIIDWLIERLPGIPRSFVEFGAQDYREANTRLLLQLRNWRGLVMDGSSENIAAIESDDVSWRHDLKAKAAFIDRDNINSLFEDSGFAGALGLVSIDVDGNDYWIWEALTVASPAIVVCEYNAVLGDLRALVVPYRGDFHRSRAHHSNLYFGASIRALIELGTRKGYAFVGTTSTGCNAFFVRNDLAQRIVGELSHFRAFPSAVRESRDVAARLTFVGGIARRAVIDSLPLIEIEANTRTTLAELDAYSPNWSAGLPVEINREREPHVTEPLTSPLR